MCFCGAPSHLGTVGTKGWFSQASVVGIATNGGTFHIYFSGLLCLNVACIQGWPVCSILGTSKSCNTRANYRNWTGTGGAELVTFLITSARLKPLGEPDTRELPPCVHMHVIYFMSVQSAHTSCSILRQMLLRDMCDREAFSLSVVCLAEWRMTAGLTAVPVRGWHTIYHNTDQVHQWLSIWFETKCTSRAMSWCTNMTGSMGVQKVFNVNVYWSRLVLFSLWKQFV